MESTRRLIQLVPCVPNVGKQYSMTLCALHTHTPPLETNLGRHDLAVGHGERLALRRPVVHQELARVQVGVGARRVRLRPHQVQHRHRVLMLLHEVVLVLRERE